MKDATHRFVSRLGVALGDMHRVVFVQAEEQLRISVTKIIDNAVMEPAIARAWIHGEIFDPHAT